MCSKSFKLFVLFLFSLPLSAGVLYNDFGSGFSFGAGVHGITSTSWAAAQFTPTLSGALTSIDIAASISSGTTTFILSLAADNSGAPGTILETFNITSIPVTAAVVTGTSSTHTMLTAGTKYWLEVGAGASTFGNWRLNDHSLLGQGASFSNGGSTWGAASLTVLPAFDVNGNTVPEPWTGTLTFLPLAALLLHRRVRVGR